MNFWVVSVLMVVAGLFGWACRELRLRSQESGSHQPVEADADRSGEVVAAPSSTAPSSTAPSSTAPSSTAPPAAEVVVATPSAPTNEAELEALKSELSRVRLELQQARTELQQARTSSPEREQPSAETGEGHPPERKPVADSQGVVEVGAGGSRLPPLPPRVARSVSEDERRLAAAQDQARFAAIQLAASRSEVQQLQARLKQANQLIRRKTELLRHAELKLGASRMGSARPSGSPKRSEPTRPLSLGSQARDAADAPQLAQLQREFEQRGVHLQEARQSSEQAQRAARELEQRLEQAQLESGSRAERIEVLLQEVGELRQRLGSLLPEPATEPALFDAPTQGAPDELKRLHGVGPKVQQLLNQLGVYYFWQIAEWKPEHVRYVEQQLPQLRGRIERDEWCQQAAALADADAALAADADAEGATASGPVPIAATGGRARAVSGASTEAKGRC